MRVSFYLAKTIKWTLLAALFLPLYVPSDLFFPFITGKNFLFRAAVEILAVLWVFLMALDKKYIPKKSLILFFVVLSVFILTLSTFFGADPSRSFWSNYERMEGLIGHLHLLVYFLMLASIFQSETDWWEFFHISILASIFVGFYASLQLAGTLTIHQGSTRIDATLGNATYLAVYLLFNLFFLLYFFLKTKSKVWRWVYAASFVFEIFLLYETATRGAILGFLGGLVVLALFLGIKAKNKIFKISAISLFLCVLLLVVGFYFAKNTEFVRGNTVLARFAALSLEEQTTQSRLIIWRLAIEGWKERPVLGWGLENFNLVFNKYFEPALWRQEPWFDRAHNAVFDHLVAGGILGLLSYLGIFFAVFYYLWKIIARDSANAPAFVALVALLAAYFFQNLFVFDQLVSYMLFYGVLAYIHYFYLREPNFSNIPAGVRSGNASLANIILIFSIIVFLPVFYFVNIKPYLQNRALINAIIQFSGGGDASTADRAKSALNYFRQALKYDTFGNRETGEQFSYFASQIANTGSVPADLRAEIANAAVAEMQKSIASSPEDARYYLFLSAVYSAYGQRQFAADSLNHALKFSPKKQQILMAMTQNYFEAKDMQKAIQFTEDAIALDPTYPAPHSNLVILAALGKNFDLANKEINFLKKLRAADADDFQKWGSVYAAAGRLSEAADFYKESIIHNSNPKNIQVRISLAALYYELGQKAEAISQIEEVISKNPDFKEQGERFIEQIRSGKKPGN